MVFIQILFVKSLPDPFTTYTPYSYLELCNGIPDDL